MKLLGVLRIQTLLLLTTLLAPISASSSPDSSSLRAVRAVRPPPLQVKPHRHRLQGDKGVPAGKKPDPKYFHEPGAGDELGHYDVRYYKQRVPYEQHGANLQHLIRSYLTVFRALGVETWLAHGTLLGWWWNGRIMPWDYDLDVQVSNDTLLYLGAHHNRTLHEYGFVDAATGRDATKTYLLDVNPHFLVSDRADGQNVIDARWIDVENGMFIDITGLAEREPESQPGIWSCKNFHRYRTRDLYPMRESEFEGVPATIPYSFERILVEEYGTKSLVMTEWGGHKWEPGLKEWVKLPTPADQLVMANHSAALTSGSL